MPWPTTQVSSELKTKPRSVLFRSGWQTINIGDIGHVVGGLRLLETYLPDVQVILWPASVDNGVEPMLRREFPQVRMVKGHLDGQGNPDQRGLQEAFTEADFFLHGSSSGVGARQQVAAWRSITGKPYGFYGVTITDFDDGLGNLLSGADFVFCRETLSVALLKDKGVTCPVIDFAPDATFAIHVRNEEQAQVYLQANGLEDGDFICAIPRLRYTPYHKLRPTNWTDEHIHMVESVNEETKERDHAKLREMITTWVRQTAKKVLVCPEMTYQVEVGKELVVDPLPDDVKKNVVWRDSYWLPDEAASVYTRAHTVVSFENHSPIIAAAMGTPAFYLRQPTDTPKGQMWRDVGLSDWIFEIDEVTDTDITQALLSVHANYPAALAAVETAMNYVKKRQQDTMEVVGRAVNRHRR